MNLILQLFFGFGLQKDAYKKTGCINLLCSGFVQTSRQLALGAALDPVSSISQTQYYITLVYFW